MQVVGVKYHPQNHLHQKINVLIVAIFFAITTFTAMLMKQMKVLQKMQGNTVKIVITNIIDINMAKQIKKKSPAGRKSIEDKKVTVCLYVRQSLLDDKGGKEEVQKQCYEFLGVSIK